MGPENERQSQPPGCSSSARLGVTLTCADFEGSREASKTIWTNTGLNRTPQVEVHCPCKAGDNNKGFGSFVKRLMDAEAAIVSAAAQLLSFKDILKDAPSSAVNRQHTVKHRKLLLQKMEDFRQINQAVRQRLNQLLDEETDRLDASTKIDGLLNKILQIERENQLLKGDLGVTQRRAEELMYLQQKEQENIKSALNIAKSAEGTRARIQGQLRNKEAENNRLTVQVRTLERTLTQHKAELDDLKASMAALIEQTSQEKEALKKASRVHKQKAERFEATLEKSLTQLQDKDAQLSYLQVKIDTWKREMEQLTEENHKLTTHVELLQKQGITISMKMQKDMEKQAVMVKEREREWEERVRQREKERIKGKEAWAEEREKEQMEWETRVKELEDRMKERKEQEHREREWVKEREAREKELEDRMKERKEQEHKEREWVKEREAREKELEDRMKERKEQEYRERKWAKGREARERELEDRMKERKEQEHKEREWVKEREEREKELEDRMKERKEQEHKEREWVKEREAREKELEDKVKERKEQENKEREWLKEREVREKELDGKMKERKEQDHMEREWVKGKEPREKELEDRMKERKEQENKEREWSKEREAREKEFEDRIKERKEQANKEKEWVKEREVMEKDLEDRMKERKEQEHKEREWEKERREWEDREKERSTGRAERERERRDWQKQYEEREKEWVREGERREMEKAREGTSNTREWQERRVEEVAETSSGHGGMAHQLERFKVQKEHDSGSYAMFKLEKQLAECEAALVQEKSEKDRIVEQIQKKLEKKLAECEAALVQEKSASSEKDRAVERVQKKLEKQLAECEAALVQEKSVSSEKDRVVEQVQKKLEKRLAECEAALVQEKSVSSEKDSTIEQVQKKVATLEAELSDAKLQYKNVSEELQKMQGEDSKAQQVRQELQGRVEELQHLPKTLKKTELRLLACQEKLQTSERKCSEQAEDITKLQFELQAQVNLVRSAVELRESADKTRSQVQEQVDRLQNTLEQLRQEKLDLERRLETQEQTLRHSSQLLEQRSTQCSELERQLEQRTFECKMLNQQLTQNSTDFLDFKEEVKNVKEQVLSKNEALQSTVNELRLLRQSKMKAEKHYEARVKELQLNLDQCESHKKSMQNYVDFLKNSYLMIFEDPISTFWSSAFVN
ncbi:golgin subfamily A member 6-like protein 22 isoform X46 [Hippocampus zosterae]|uniref:golgin subfamily A member 6-like protein 22 isoform X46 n=1 Tax=Hippocampus zosterae TaxID=109293 RepID=UPI00223E42FD|nr:golgin subfamily A member 6-like protein 22 isoform X46 [Hippocampus zosterae]